ncbi:MAG: cupin domain-containing protein [Hyphomonadaceae bacterium]|nr:cupin domain-containing protein [Hyphomonadaceae bacterium]
MTITYGPAAARAFLPWGEGAQVAILRSHPSGGVTTLTRFAAGATGRRHAHPGGEELYVVSGRARVGGHELAAGDYLYTPPGAAHDVHAHEETVFLLVLPLAPDYAIAADPPSEG